MLSNEELPPISEIKDYLNRILMLGERIGAPIENSDRKLAEDLGNISYSLFCLNKQTKKTFTICDDPKIRKMRISEDADGFSENDTFYINNFIRINLLDAFSELVAASYLVKRLNKSRLFAAELYSRYSGKKHAVFFANSQDEVYVYNEELTNINLQEYVSNYFSASFETDDNITKICEIATSNDSFSQKQRKIAMAANEFNNNIANKHSFIFGAITFLDFLGWKGLWQSQKESEQGALQKVSQLIEDFRERLNSLSQDYFKEAKEIPLSSLISISDTIAVFSPLTSKAEISQLLEIHANFSRYVLEKCCNNGFPIRGAITYGEYSTMNNVMIGPGIDECASWHESSNWIGVHLTPSAQFYWKNTENSNVLIYNHIPLKNGHKLMYCVRWEISKNAFIKLALKSRALLPEIAAKYTNTLEFLEETAWKIEGGVGDG